MTTQDNSPHFAFALGYWQGRACGHFENGTYENMAEHKQVDYKNGYDAGVADYCEMDMGETT